MRLYVGGTHICHHLQCAMARYCALQNAPRTGKSANVRHHLASARKNACHPLPPASSPSRARTGPHVHSRCTLHKDTQAHARASATQCALLSFPKNFQNARATYAHMTGMYNILWDTHVRAGMHAGLPGGIVW